MRRRVASFSAVFVILIMFLIGNASATSTPQPQASIAPVSLPFFGGTNSLTGTVFDGDGKVIPMAKVTLFYSVWVDNGYKARDQVKTNYGDNPQYTGSSGLYAFNDIPLGAYVLVAEKDGYLVSDVITLSTGATNKNLIISGYVANNATATPQPTPRNSPTSNPSPFPDIQIPDIGSILVNALRFLLMSLICAQFIMGVLIILWRRR